MNLNKKIFLFFFNLLLITYSNEINVCIENICDETIIINQENKINLDNYFIDLDSNDINIDFYSRKDCPHCTTIKLFLDELKKNHTEIKINIYEIEKSINARYLFALNQKYEINEMFFGAVPAIFISNKYYIGDSNKIREQITDTIIEYKQKEIGLKSPTKILKQINLNQEQIMKNYEKNDFVGLFFIFFKDNFSFCMFSKIILFIFILKINEKLAIFSLFFVFFSYFLIDFIIYLNFFNYLEKLSFFIFIIYPISSIISFMFFLFYIKKYREDEDFKKQKEKLKVLKEKIIKTRKKEIYLICFFVFLSFCFSEFLCLDQINKSTRMFLHTTQEINNNLFFIIFYNITITLPLFFIFFILKILKSKNILKINLIIGFLFFIFGMLLLYFCFELLGLVYPFKNIGLMF